MVKLVEAMQSDPGWATPCLVLSDQASAPGVAKAEDLGVPSLVIEGTKRRSGRATFESAVHGALVERKADFICLAGFMRIFSADFVGQWSGRLLNIHPSLLPRHKGLNTHARAIEAGDAEHGCSVHQVTPALDDGPVLGQAKIPVLCDDTPETLAARVLVMEHKLYPAVLKRVVNGSSEPLYLP
ncbi:MAG: phosphoribosylglycinamide formyltransferase [Pseudomonadota bacterium]